MNKAAGVDLDLLKKWAALLLSGAAVVALDAQLRLPGQGLWERIFEGMFVATPVLCGVGVGLFRVRHRSGWLLIAGSGLALMLAQDLLPDRREDASVSIRVLSAETGATTRSAPRPRWNASGALGRVLRPASAGEMAASGFARFERPFAFVKTGFLMTPFIIAGLMAQVITWARGILFVSDRVAQVFFGVVTWVLPMLLVWLPLQLSNALLVQVVDQGTPPTILLLPFTVLLVLTLFIRAFD